MVQVKEFANYICKVVHEYSKLIIPKICLKSQNCIIDTEWIIFKSVNERNRRNDRIYKWNILNSLILQWIKQKALREPFNKRNKVIKIHYTEDLENYHFIISNIENRSRSTHALFHYQKTHIHAILILLLIFVLNVQSFQLNQVANFKKIVSKK